MKSLINNLLAKKSTKSTRRRPKLSVETLGDRTLMAASLTASLNVADGILRIEGTYGDDRIHIRQGLSTIRIDGVSIAVTDGDVTTPTAVVQRNQISKIVVAGLDGNDRVEMHDLVAPLASVTPLVIHGGMGNDTLIGGKGADTIFGESGVDSILGGNGKDVIYGDANPAAAQVVRDYGLSVANDFFNSLGKNEKWIGPYTGSYEEGKEFYITPDGGLYQYSLSANGQYTIIDTFVEQLDTSYYQDIRKLETERGLYPADLYYGWGARGEKWFHVGGDPTTDDWSWITPAGELYRWDGKYDLPATGTLIATLDWTALADPYEFAKAATDDGANDILNGQDGDDSIDGGAGDDFLKGVYGNDTLIGGIGNDILAGFVGSDLLDGGDGDDSMWGEGDNDTLIGGIGSDTLSGYTGNDSLVGGDGKDSMLGGDGHDVLYGGEGDDRMAGENGNDLLNGEQGNDDVWGAKFGFNTDVFGANDTINGGAGSDTLSGGNGDDLVAGEDDNDLIQGGSGNDLLIGCFNGWHGEAGNPNDTIYGGKGNDSLYGGDGADQLIGEAGDNLFYGEDGNDTLVGLAGKDIMIAGPGVDLLDGGSGDDELYGEDGSDYIVGGPGLNTLVGGSGSDFLAGGQQADLMCGGQRFSAIEIGEANDTMYGYGGNDTVFGGDGNDSMRGGFGNDWLNGEDGNDGLYGEYDNDDLHGGRGTDVLEGDWGDDNLSGGEGLDFLSGGFNNDTLYGADWQNNYTYQDAGNFLYGNDGNDNLYGGNGSDYMEGGANNDGLFGGLGFNTLKGMGGADRFLTWASASDTVSDAEAEDATIGFVDSPALTNVAPPAGWPTTQPYNFNAGAWTAAEISSADQAFGNLHRLTRNTRLLELSNGNGYVFTRRGQQTSGAYAYGGENDGAGNITIGQLRNPTLATNTMLQTIYHEIGHSWGTTAVNRRYQAFVNLSGWVMNPSDTRGLTQGLDADTATPGNANAWWHRSTAQFARAAAPAGDDYSRLSPGEDWGTTWETYFMEKYHGTLMNNNRVQSKYDNLDLLFRDLRS